MRGIDVLYVHAGALIGIQTVLGLERVGRAHLSADGRHAGPVQILERAHPTFDEPTTGVVVGDTLFYLANSQTKRLDDFGRLEPSSRIGGTILLRLRLPAHEIIPARRGTTARP